MIITWRVFETSVFAVHTKDLRFKSRHFQKRFWKPANYGNSLLNTRRDSVQNSVWLIAHAHLWKNAGLFRRRHALQPAHANL